MKRNKPINKVSDKQKVKNARELPIKIEIIKRAKNRCEVCGRLGSWLYPLSVHHKKIGADREEIKSVDDGEALCIICHSKKHGINAKFSEPQWSKEG